ncbi:protein of unknown function (DUF1858) [Chthonomonas calidirosea]|uniref:DUF1858 domain-containing protein n=2 Tax=Chthonomonas TaxID=1077265 RepID=S0EW70_CHTCT|nr:DUF1858 domain-containing protein [Chthonomonas calidirosea]CCW36118.1 Domain of unknown function (DUF1858)./Uncharacterized conserved protein (DUF2249) [Chthonomonas calidirosea T49]CEK17234.1 protein of unknown function (DUF1858) [Chthonomonas calidirosea]CEK18286.1 protein of unknown function (DUF1858) [Chthonomonas calidirosea]
MRVPPDMKIKKVLELYEGMLDVVVELSPEFKRLRNPVLRKAMTNRITVEQAARIAGVPLARMLYTLNVAAGEDPQWIIEELKTLPYAAHEVQPVNPSHKPQELAELADSDPRIQFLDLMPFDERQEDPLPTILKQLVALKDKQQILLIRHPFDPIPLRDLALKFGFSSWAEERAPHEWFTYFYRPAQSKEK